MGSRPMYMLVTLVFPVMSILFFSSLFKEGLPVKMPIAIVDLDNTATSRKLARAIEVTQMTEVVMHPQSEAEGMSQMRTCNVYGMVVLPAGLQADIQSMKTPQVTYYYQSGLLIAGGMMQSALATALNTISGGIKLQKRQAMGQNEYEAMAQIQPVQLSMHQLFNPMTNYTIYISTIIMPIVLQLLILLMTVYCIGIEIKEKTSREWLHASDKSLVAALTGKLLPYTLVFFVVMLFQNFMLYKVFQVPINAGTGWLIALSLLFVLTYQALGIFLIALLPVLRHALYATVFYGILALTLCGFTFPTTSMHIVFQIWAGAFPVRHYMEIFQSQILAGFEFKYTAMSYAMLLLFLFLPFALIPRLKSALIYQNFVEKPSVNHKVVGINSLPPSE